MPYHIVYSPEASEHLQAFNVHDQRVITDDVDEQLTHQLSRWWKRGIERRCGRIPWLLGNFA